jgi:nucleotide-binding universal stress UspA family protein
MFQRIVAAYDGSEWSRRAMRLAGQIARENAESQIWIICAMGVTPAISEALANQWSAEQTIIGETQLDEAQELLGDAPNVHRKLLFAPPAESIVDVANARQADLIVIGSRGLGALGGLLLGSQSHKVISLARCPVLVVK